MTYTGATLIPPDTEVFFRVLDIGAPAYVDNCVNPTDPLSIRISRPLYLKDWTTGRFAPGSSTTAEHPIQ